MTIFAFEQVAGVNPQSQFVSAGADIAMGEHGVRGRIFFASRGGAVVVCAAFDETHAGNVDLTRLLREGRLAAKVEFESRAGLQIVNRVWLTQAHGLRAFRKGAPHSMLSDDCRYWSPAIAIAGMAQGARETLPVVSAGRPDGDSVVEIAIRGDIGEGKNTSSRILALIGDAERCKRSIVLDLASQGGDAVQGLEIYRALAEWPFAVYANIDRAMSMAAVVSMAADVRTIRPDGEMLLHRCAIETFPKSNRHDAAALRRVARDMEALDRQIAGIVAAATGFDVESVEALMEPETTFTAGAALAAGLVHAVREKDVPDMPRARRATFQPINGPFRVARSGAR